MLRRADPPGARLALLGQVLLVVLLAAQAWALYAPSVPGPDTGLPGQDKIGHALLFAVPTWVARSLGP